jgi:hypothetical protein
MQRTHPKGTNVTNTERSPKAPCTGAGFFAPLCGALGLRGSGAPCHRLPRIRFALAVLVATFAISAATTSAAQVRVFTGTFGSAASTTADPYPIESGWGVAVDTSSGPSRGDVYVSDGANHRIEKFDSSGHFLLMFGKEVNRTAVEESRASEENVCPAAGHPSDVCQPGTAGTAPGSFGGGANGEPEILSLAVDGSSGPSAGDLYVGDYSDGKVTKFDESGHLVSTWATGGQLDGSDVTHPTAPVSGPFGKVGGIAVDPAGNLWVRGSSVVFEFKQDAGFATDWEPLSLTGSDAAEGLVGFAVDSKDDVYLSSGPATIKFGSTGIEIGPIDLYQGGGQKEALTVDPSTDDLYVEEASPDRAPIIQRYDSACQPQAFSPVPCTPAETFASPNLRLGKGLAIDSSTTAKTLYATRQDAFGAEVAAFAIETVPDATTLKPSATTPTTATIAGTVNPAGVELKVGTEGCRFEWGETTAYGNTAPCDKTAAQIGSGASPVEVHATIPIQVAHTYHYRFVAANANDVNSVVDEPSQGEDLAFGPPRIDSTSASEVTATSATLQAEIVPQNISTTYRFEYLSEEGFQADGETFSGPSAPVSVPIPNAPLGSGGADAEAFQHLQGLVPNTIYRYRVLAENALANGAAAVLGPARSFTTQAPASFGLPDGRGWELVSPPEKRGAALSGISEGNLIQAAASGEAISYGTYAPTEAEPQGNASAIQVLSARGAGGWSSRDLVIPHSQAVGLVVGGGSEYSLFSADLSQGLLQPFGVFEPSLSPQATEQTPFLQTNFTASGPPAFCSESCYHPLLTGAEGIADVAPGTEFGEAGLCPFLDNIRCGPHVLGATPDLSHLILNAKAPLLAENNDLYELSVAAPPTESLRPIAVLPDGQPAPRANLGDSTEKSEGNARDAISADGSRVVFSAAPSNFEGAHLYLRLNATQEASSISGSAVDGSQCTELEAAKACTIRLDALQGGSDDSGEATFQLASADGRRVFFTDPSRLTADSNAEHDSPDLYEYDLQRPLGQRLADLSAGPEPGGVQGLVAGASTDGESLYFVANGILAANQGLDGTHAVPGDCPSEQGDSAQTCNLYLRREGTTSFIATLSGEDYPDWSPHLKTLTARVSSDGRWLAFMSDRSLTGYDNRDAVSGKPDEEVYLYDAQASGGKGKLTCASCNPSGARPHGVEYHPGAPGGAPSLPLAGGDRVWGDSTWLAANIPGWTTYAGEDARYQSRYLSDQGRLFFNSSDALLPQDTNGVEDVYEYEPPTGAEGPPNDTCTEQDSTYSPASQGCVSLISSGTSARESAFLDASESGDDVFFLTSARLTPKDPDTAVDVYDARVDGGEGEPIKPPSCEGDACQSPVAAPEDPTPGSLSFQGPGNPLPPVSASVTGKAKPPTRAQKLARALKACAKRPKRKRSACERQARRAYGPKGKAKKSNRRAQ